MKKFNKKQLAKIAAIAKKFGVSKNEAAQMYVRSGIQ